MLKVDCRGMQCPAPLISLKKALKESQELEILIDNDTSLGNVSRFLSDNKIDFSTVKSDTLNIVYINSTPISDIQPEFQVADVVIVISSDSMGQGSDELGKILIKGYISTLSEMDLLPSELIFYNSGVLLTVNDSPVMSLLKALEDKGVKITICGTCVDYFGIKQNISIGTISNMYSISESLLKATKVIRP